MLGLLTVTQGPDKGKNLFFGRQKVTIGRATNATIGLTDPQTSRIHCEVVYEGDKVTVSDARSSSGTWVNGTQIHKPQPLQPGDVIVIGQTQLSFQWSDADQRATEGWESSLPNPS